MTDHTKVCIEIGDTATSGPTAAPNAIDKGARAVNSDILLTLHAKTILTDEDVKRILDHGINVGERHPEYRMEDMAERFCEIKKDADRLRAMRDGRGKSFGTVINCMRCDIENERIRHYARKDWPEGRYIFVQAPMNGSPYPAIRCEDGTVEPYWAVIKTIFSDDWRVVG